MNKNYCLTGRKVIIRRLFKQDIGDIISCYGKYTNLYHNPICPAFLENVLLNGEIWGAFHDDKIIGCCYYFPLNSSFFTPSPFSESLNDFIKETDIYFYMGYVGIKDSNIPIYENEDSNMPAESGLYQVFLNIAQMQAFRRGLKYIIHCCPAKFSFPAETLFACGYRLIKLRGLENLVVHYIFAKPVLSEENIYETDTAYSPRKIPFDSTKKVSALLENGYCGVDYCKNENVLLMCRLIAD